MKLTVKFAGQERTIEFTDSYKPESASAGCSFFSSEKLAVRIGGGEKLHGAILYAKTEKPACYDIDNSVQVEANGVTYWVYPSRPRNSKHVTVAGWADNVDQAAGTNQAYYGAL